MVINKTSIHIKERENNMGTKFISLIYFLFLFVGCATFKPPTTYKFENQRTYNKTYDEVWEKAIEYFALNATPVKNIDKQSGFVASDMNLSISNYPEYSDCGIGERGLFHIITIINPIGHFNVLIKKINENQTNVIITVVFSATIESQIATSYGVQYRYDKTSCNSKGVMEKQFLNYIAK